MIQLQTKVKIIDNSGGFIGRCIKILEPHGRDFAKVGDIILISIKETVNFPLGGNKGKKTLKGGSPSGRRDKITKGSMSKALVVRTKSHNLKNVGLFNDNAVILLKSNVSNTKKNLGITPMGSRIKGPISNELNKINKLSTRNEANAKFHKILSLSRLHH